ncbi:MAG: ribonuclease H-like domain-containing protein [Nanoarchaeota archaeon]|nr:ribonuclease H-like domain-containing protein [Nanoarchaeota archaeon]
MELSDVLNGKEVKHEGGYFYSIERNIEELPIKRLTSAIKLGYPSINPSVLAQTFPVYSHQSMEDIPPRHLVEKALFIDIETRGLAHRHPIFLISLGQYSEEGMKITSVLARDYSEERTMLSYFLQLLHNSTSQITFNGHRFDLPHIGRRAQHQGLMINGYRYRELAEVLRGTHTDLIDHFNGKLQDIEKLRFGFARRGDIPGAAIPEIYRNYVYGLGDQDEVVQQIKSIVLHNMVDVASIGALFADRCRESAEENLLTRSLAA